MAFFQTKTLKMIIRTYISSKAWEIYFFGKYDIFVKYFSIIYIYFRLVLGKENPVFEAVFTTFFIWGHLLDDS